VSLSSGLSRRAVLKGVLGVAALPLVGFTSEPRQGPVPADPFTLGVASGEPAPDGVVIWTRLAPHPSRTGCRCSSDSAEMAFRQRKCEADSYGQRNIQ
jgi:phosphodiesterase/alkaline phosphatase D-like protein